MQHSEEEIEDAPEPEVKRPRPAIGDLAAEWTRAREADRSEVGRMVTRAGGAAHFVTGSLPGIEGGSYATNDGLLRETVAFYDSARARLGECARCPRDGGACRSARGAIDAGRVPLIAKDGTPTTRDCDRWRRYRAIEVLARAGVSRYLGGWTFAKFAQTYGDVPRAPFAWAWQFFDDGLDVAEPWCVMYGHDAEAAQRLAIAVVNTLVFRAKLRGVTYRAVAEMARTERESWKFADVESPFDRASEVPVLLLDGVAAGESWLIAKTAGLLEQRRHACRPTLIVVHGNPAHVRSTYRGVPGFAEGYEAHVGTRVREDTPAKAPASAPSADKPRPAHAAMAIPKVPPRKK